MQLKGRDRTPFAVTKHAMDRGERAAIRQYRLAKVDDDGVPARQVKEPSKRRVQTCVVPVSDILDCTHVESQVREDGLKEPPRQQQLGGSYVGEVLKVSVAVEATGSKPSATMLNDGVPREKCVRNLVPDGEVPSVRSVRAAHLDDESAAL